MNMNSLKNGYWYTESDLLENPEKYQKSPFLGLEFMINYLNKRNSVITHLQESQKFKKKAENSEYIDNIKIKFSEIITKEEIHLEKLLKAIINEKKLQSKDKQLDELIDIFLKKFEVKKRLYILYDNNFQDKTKNFKKLINYILLAHLCIIRYHETLNLKFLNTLLKINDTICSQLNYIKNSTEKKLLVESLKDEIEIIKNLCNKKGVELELK